MSLILFFQIQLNHAKNKNKTNVLNDVMLHSRISDIKNHFVVFVQMKASLVFNFKRN